MDMFVCKPLDPVTLARVRTDADQVPRNQGIGLNFLPLSVSVHLNGIRLDRHRPELGKSFDSLITGGVISIDVNDSQTRTNLEHNCALKYDQHEPREQTVVPVFIQTPQGDAENLEHEERRNSMLCKELRELGDRNMARVGSELGRQVGNGNVGR
jgi:hypothetical protein